MDILDILVSAISIIIALLVYLLGYNPVYKTADPAIMISNAEFIGGNQPQMIVNGGFVSGALPPLPFSLNTARRILAEIEKPTISKPATEEPRDRIQILAKDDEGFARLYTIVSRYITVYGHKSKSRDDVLNIINSDSETDFQNKIDALSIEPPAVLDMSDLYDIFINDYMPKQAIGNVLCISPTGAKNNFLDLLDHTGEGRYISIETFMNEVPHPHSVIVADRCLEFAESAESLVSKLGESLADDGILIVRSYNCLSSADKALSDVVECLQRDTKLSDIRGKYENYTTWNNRLTHVFKLDYQSVEHGPIDMWIGIYRKKSFKAL